MARYGSVALIVAAFVGIIAGGVAYAISYSVLVALGVTIAILIVSVYILTRPSEVRAPGDTAPREHQAFEE